MFGTHKRYAPAARVASAEALGQLAGSADLEDDIALCPFQTIEPVFRAHLPAGERILEAGCGRGRWVFHLRRLGFDVIGLDLAKSDLVRARRHDPSVPVACGDVVKTAFADAGFGAVISLGVVEHFEEGPQAALAEVRRLLRPGGVFLVTVPTQNLLRVLVFNRLKDLQWIVRRLRGRALMFEEYRYSRARFSRILREAGFEIVELHPDDFRPPKNMGLYTDSGFFQHPVNRWELNGAGRLVNRILGGLSPWLLCSGTLWVCRRP